MSSPYAKLAINLVLSTLVMYFVMFSMIDGFGDFYNNLNMFYMALMMVAPMAILMLVLMKSMYSNRALNFALHVAFVVVFVGAFWFIRSQAAIGDVQFVRSMIPHHSGAILMCQEASISDAELSTLCEEIIQAQREEIERMRAILDRLKR